MKIDVIYGHFFGFPKEISPDVKDYREWLVNNGYPKPLLDALGNNVDIMLFNDTDDKARFNFSTVLKYESLATGNTLWASVEDAQLWLDKYVLTGIRPTGATAKNRYMDVFSSVRCRDTVVNVLGCLLYYYQEQQLNKTNEHEQQNSNSDNHLAHGE